MTMFSIQIKDNGLLNRLKDSRRKLGDTRALHKRFGVVGLRWVTDNFRTSGGKAGGWKALSANTIAQRRKGSSQVLRDSGQMMQSFSWEADASKAKVGSPQKKAKWHDQGTDPYTISARQGGLLRFRTADGWVAVSRVNHPGIPQRRILPEKKETEDEIMRPTTEQYMREAFGRLMSR